MTPEQIADLAKCYTCMDETQKRAAIVYLLDQLVSLGGGAESDTSLTITGTGGNGFIQLPSQSSAPACPTTGFRLYADATGRFSWIRASDCFTRTWDATLTANRVYTLKDATGTVPLLEVANTWSANGALSAPAVSITGTPITGGSATTTKPLVLIETSGATSNGWSTSGTMLGVNAPSGFAGNIVDFQNNASARMSLSSGGTLTVAAGINAGGSVSAGSGATTQFSFSGGRGVLTSTGAGSIQFGAVDAAAPVAQTLSVQSVVAGTANTAGAAFTIKGSAGTGTGAGGVINLQVAPAAGAGSTQNTFVTAWQVGATGHFLTGTDNTYDIGASAATRPRTAYIGTSIEIVNSNSIIDVNGYRAPAAGNFYWSARSKFGSPSDGVITLSNNAVNDFGRLQLGGTTSSFPSLKRVSATVAVRLADDSADAGITASTAVFSSTVRLAPYTVATLPAAGTAGRRAYVTDATAPTYLGALVGGGAVVCPVFDNGSAWVSC